MDQRKKVMERITHGVYVIGVKDRDKANLMTAAWLCQVSGSPPMVAVTVGNTHYTSELLQSSPMFSVSILKNSQKEIAKQCGKISGRNQDKLQLVQTSSVQHGLPVIDGAAGYLVGKIKQVIPVTNHTMYIAEVLEAASSDDAEALLLYHEKDFFN